MRLQRGGEMHRCRVGPLEPDGGAIHHRVEIALVDRREETDFGLGIDRLCLDVEPVRTCLGMDLHHSGRLACDRLILRDDDRDRLAAVEDDVGVHQRQRTGVGLSCGHARIAVNDRDHPGQRLGGARVDTEDTTATDRCADDRRIGNAVGRTFIRIVRDPGDLRRPLDPVKPEPENALLRAGQATRPERRIHHVFVHSAVLGWREGYG